MLELSEDADMPRRLETGLKQEPHREIYKYENADEGFVPVNWSILGLTGHGSKRKG